MQFWMRRMGLSGAVREAGYDLVTRELFMPDAFARTALNIAFLHLPDWHNTADPDAVEGKLNLFLKALESGAWRQLSARGLVVLVGPWQEACPRVQKVFQSFLQKLEHAASESSSGLECVFPAELREVLGGHEAFDEVAMRVGQIPFSEEMLVAMSACLARRMHRLLLPPVKAIAVDCDETLWGNAVGEVGAEGVELSERFQRLQEKLAGLAARGTLLCLCSRNKFEDVRRVFWEREREMPLKWSHVTAWVIDELDKAAGIRQLGAQLKLSLDAFALLDDNPAECLRVRAELPAVMVWHLPEDAGTWEVRMKQAWLLDERSRGAGTSEDRSRVKMYQEEQSRAAMRQSCASVAEYHQLLGSEISVEAAGEEDAERLSQLSERTNQFNAFKRFVSTRDVARYKEHGGKLRKVSLRDNFGDYGVIGVVMMRRASAFTVRWQENADGMTFDPPPASCELGREGANSADRRVEVDIFAMSCRALGRGVEHAMLTSVAEFAKEVGEGGAWVTVKFRSNDRNKLVRHFLEWAASESGGSAGEEEFSYPVHGLLSLNFDCSRMNYALAYSDVSSSPPPSSGEVESSAVARAELMWELSRGGLMTPESILQAMADMKRKTRREKERNGSQQGNGIVSDKPRRPASSDKDASWYHKRRPKKERQVAEQLKGIWSEVRALPLVCDLVKLLEVLGVEEVKTNVPFMEYGGDSLTGVTVIAKAFRQGISLQLLPNLGDNKATDRMCCIASPLFANQPVADFVSLLNLLAVHHLVACLFHIPLTAPFSIF
eukprot:503379-Hanusia_phi.AAC.3